MLHVQLLVCLSVSLLQVSKSDTAVFIFPWGQDSLRIVVQQATAGQKSKPVPLEVENGNIRASVSTKGLITITRVDDGHVILSELSRDWANHDGQSQWRQPSNTGHAPFALSLRWDSVNETSIISTDISFDVLDQVWGPLDKDTGKLYAPLNSGCANPRKDGKVEVIDCTQAAKWTYNSTTQLLQVNDKCVVNAGERQPVQLVPCNASNEDQQWGYIDYAPPQTRVSQTFASTPSERIFGTGEHENGKLNQKGQSYDFLRCLQYKYSHGSEVCLPFVLGAQDGRVQYGFLWNMTNYGQVTFNDHNTTWTAEEATEIDLFVTTSGTNASSAEAVVQIMKNYVDAVGHSPVPPEYALGYWHSKNRYKSQEELLEAAQNFSHYNIPVSYIVIDYFHWKYMGDWSFDPEYWPDPRAMVNEIEKLGMRVMVTVWPFSTPQSSSFKTLQEYIYVAQDGVSSEGIGYPNTNCHGFCYLYDPTQAAARSYVWSRIKAGYYDYGIKAFWLDATEPASVDGPPPSTRYSNGYTQVNGRLFPEHHERMIRDGLASEGENDTAVILMRSTWPGAWRSAATVLWSGDIESDFDTLKKSVQAGLGVQLSGVALWTTDIGGYHGGKADDPEFRELVARWFQFGFTCPIFRQHGNRATEPWLYGNESFASIRKTIQLRETFRPYVASLMENVSRSGIPVDRPLWFDFPDDPLTWDVDDVYMFGPDYLVAPVVEYKATSRSLYLPVGSRWMYYFNGTVCEGGKNVTVQTPLDEFPLFKRMT
ncbi:uncharacterized family 31 glucosidase ORF2-like [Oscarella lobularis]|uniref:uncharacterized family 31 glucosidase ORF2-like n=1 Tax=Oscarella lobularis TaxID=121494 RepID=UPI0033131797